MNPPKMYIHIGDYKRDTGHLRAAEHGAYLMLLFHYWSTGALPDDDRQLASIACMTRGEWHKARPIIQPLFQPGWKHKRVDFELQKAARISEAGREAGLASGRTRAQRKSNDRSNDSPTIVEPTLEPLNHLEESKIPASAGTATSKYAFESGIIRLVEKDFNQWKQSFSYLDVPAELLSMTAWAGDQGPSRWFNAVANLLAKRNREAKISAEKQQQQPFKWNGLEGVT